MPLLTGIFASAISGRLTPADAGSMFPLGVFTLSSAQATVTFTNIPQTYTHLQVRYLIRNNDSAGSRMRVRLNSDSGSNYAIHLLNAEGSGTPGSIAGASTNLTLGSSITNSSDLASTFVAGVIDLLDYRNTNKNKTLRQFTGIDRNGTGEVGLWSGLWMNTAAVTTLTFLLDNNNNFAPNSTIALYGVL